MRAVVFINSNSRQASRLIEAIKAAFQGSDIPYKILDIIIVNDTLPFPEAIRKLQSYNSLDCVIIGGGDGTITSIFNALKDRELVYGFLPLGTANVFVRSLGLPLDYKEALDVLRNAAPVPITLGQAGKALFSNSCSIGVPVRVASNVSTTTKKIFGELAYVLSGIKELLRHRAITCELQTEDNTYAFRTHHLTVANGHYQGSYPIDQEASVYKDKLVAVAFGVGQSRLSYGLAMISFAFARHRPDKNVRIMTFKEGSLITRPIRKIEADGEPLGHTPCKFRAITHAARVLMPVSDD